MVRCVCALWGVISCPRSFRAFICETLIFFFCSVSALAQYRFDSWTTENGLPNNWIRALHQTRDGYLWLTTLGGVVRFDGVRFRIFDQVNTPGLASNTFSYRAMWEDAQGDLWMGTEHNGAIRYHNGVFIPLTTREGLPSNQVIRIDGDAAGTVWITTSSGVVRWKDGHLILPRSESDRLLDAYLSAPKNLGVDGYLFGLWRCTGESWQRFAYGHWSTLPLPPDLHGPAAFQIAGIAEDSERRLWYSLQGRQHEYYCVSNGHLKIFHNVPAVSGTQICCQDRQRRVWMGNHYGAVGLWENGRLRQLPGIATANVFQVLEDREGTLWIGTLDRGLYRLRSQVVNMYRRPGGVQEANIMGPILQARDGTVWLHSGGFSQFDHGQFKNFYRQDHPRNAWDWANWVTALYEDQDGSIWVSTLDGIVRFKGGRLCEEKSLSSQIKGRVLAILRDHQGDLWFGSDQGLYRLHQDNLTRFTVRDGLPDSAVNDLREDHTGVLWIGTNSGLVWYSEGRFTTVDGTRATRVIGLYEDRSGILWVGTHDSGLYRLERAAQSLKLTRYTTLQGLYSDQAYEILEDGMGYLWMSCARGLYRVRKQELNDFAAGRTSYVTSTHFGNADGLSSECNSVGQPMAFKARDGRLWFATQDGIAVVDPSAISASLRPPPVLIEDCIVDGRPVNCKLGLQLKPGQVNLEINYTALSFIKSGQIRFRYQLQGLDRDWIEVGTTRSANYSRLPPGKYVFRVTAASPDCAWNPRSETLAVVVLPAFYQAGWFFAILLATGVGAIVLAWRIRISQLKSAHAAQQAFSRQLIASQEAERKRIASELHDSLGQRLVIIKNLALISLNGERANEAGQIPMKQVSMEAAQALGEIREISHNLRPYQLDQLGLTKAVEAILKKASNATTIAFEVAIDEIDGLFPKDLEINFYRIVQEAINNLMKHSEATQAMVVIKCAPNEVLVTVQDNGRGFAPGASDLAQGVGGFGLIGISERARLLGGNLVIKSAPGQGTTLNIKIPLATCRHEK